LDDRPLRNRVAGEVAGIVLAQPQDREKPPMMLYTGRRGPVGRPPLFSNSGEPATGRGPAIDKDAGITFLD
jgi:hypothetical protein